VIVEEGFRKGLIKTISATPTLAAGLNLPARRVIIRDYQRFATGEGMQPIPVSEYHQMAGRAGRPQLDPYGEAVLIAKGKEQVEELFEWYIEAPPEEVHSKIAEPAALYAHVLSLIASGFTKNRHELNRFMDRTFYVHEHRQGRLLQRVVDTALAFLVNADMVMEVGEYLSSTNFGTLVSKLYIDPRSAALIVGALREREIYSDLGLLQVICSTPDMPNLYVRNSDLAALTRMMDDHAEELWFPPPCEGEGEIYYRALKTAMLLSDWTDELSDAKICERYSVGPGDIYGMVESMTWLLHATSELTRMFASAFHTKVQEYEICMKNGSRRELLPLIRLRGVGRVRARRLFNNRMTTPDEILEHGIDEVTKILGHGIAEQIFNQILRKKAAPVKDNCNSHPGQSTLSHFGG
jgi:helicase